MMRIQLRTMRSRTPGWITWVLASTIALISVLPASAQTSSRKRPVDEQAPTPAPKRNARPKVKQEADSDPADTAARHSSTKTKPNVPRPPALPLEPKKTTQDQEDTVAANSTTAATASVLPETLVEFGAQPAGVRKLIESSLDLARQNLTYTFGSADPASGGMDCSGFIYHLLRQYGLTKVPRDSSGQYVWARQARGFRAVFSRKPDSFEMDELLPGDLLFWIGTYATDHDPPISHVMIYLGTEKVGGSKIMIGSSDGRSYHSQRRNGVSVFDFTMPRTPATGEARSTFIGYARIPGLRD